MVGVQGRKFAYEIIKNHFGDLVGKVCKCLLSKGPLSLQDLARFTEMPVPQLRNCLLVLIQHNCVQAYKVHVEGGGLAPPKDTTSYVAIVSNILHRKRFPKFLMLVRQDLGEEAEALVEGLLQHGRLTVEQLVQRAAANASKSKQPEDDQVIRDTFAKLVRAHYVERCPSPEPFVQPRPPPETKRSRNNPAASSERTLETEEKRILAAAAPMDAERFLLASSSIAKKSEIDDFTAPEEKVGQKRKIDALGMDTKTMTIIEEKEIVWRVNFEEFVRRFRHQACVNEVRSKIDAGTACILECMLEATQTSETDSKQRYSAPLTMEEITQAVRATSEGRTMTMERIRAALQMMCAESVGFVSKQGDLGSQYVINMSKIIEAARKYEVEAIVLQRYGKESCRIFRLLCTKGQLEQKQISDLALVALKDTREILYKLLKEEYLQLQEVSKAADHAVSKTFYLWRVNYPCVVEHVLEDMFHAASNVEHRLAYEEQQEQEVLEVYKQYTSNKSNSDSSHVSLTKTQREQLSRLRRIAAVMVASLMKLDNSIMLFNDF